MNQTVTDPAMKKLQKELRITRFFCILTSLLIICMLVGGVLVVNGVKGYVDEIWPLTEQIVSVDWEGLSAQLNDLDVEAINSTMKGLDTEELSKTLKNLNQVSESLSGMLQSVRGTGR